MNAGGVTISPEFGLVRPPDCPKEWGRLTHVLSLSQEVKGIPMRSSLTLWLLLACVLALAPPLRADAQGGATPATPSSSVLTSLPSGQPVLRFIPPDWAKGCSGTVANILRNHVLPKAGDAVEANAELSYDSEQVDEGIDQRVAADEKTLGFKDLPPLHTMTAEQAAKLPSKIGRRVNAAENFDPALVPLEDEEHAIDCESAALQQAYPDVEQRPIPPPSPRHDVPEIAWAAKIVASIPGATSAPTASAPSKRSQKARRTWEIHDGMGVVTFCPSLELWNQMDRLYADYTLTGDERSQQQARRIQFEICSSLRNGTPVFVDAIVKDVFGEMVAEITLAKLPDIHGVIEAKSAIRRAPRTSEASASLPSIGTAQWVQIPSDAPMMNEYVDKAAIRKDGAFAWLLELGEFAHPLLYTGTKGTRPLIVKSAMHEREFDCQKKLDRAVAAVAFSGPMATGIQSPLSLPANEWGAVTEPAESAEYSMVCH